MLRPVATNLWTLDLPYRARFLSELGMRMTIVRAPGGEVALISPVPLGAPELDAIRAIGPVRWLIAPNKLHHLYLGPAHQAFPDAALFGAPGLQKKKPELTLRDLISDGQPLDGVLDRQLIAGMPGLNEVALLHAPSRTLIVTDLLFNVQQARGLVLRAYLGLSRGYRRPSQTLSIKTFVKDRAALKASRDALLQRDFDRVIMAHGEIIDHDGKGAVAAAMAWLG